MVRTATSQAMARASRWGSPAQGEQEIARLEGMCSDGLDHAQTGGDGPGDVNAVQVALGNLGGVAFLVAETLHPESEAVPLPPEDRLPHGPGHRHSDGADDPLEHAAALGGMAAGAVSISGPAPQLHRASPLGAVRRPQIGRGRLGPAAGVGQRVAAPDVQDRRFRARP